MRIFGLTGGSGTGKTTAAKIFEENGIYVVYADKNARNVEKNGTQCFDEIVSMFGTDILRSDGELDRRKLGRIVFEDRKKLKTLSQITHHYIKYDIMRELREVDRELTVIDGAVIFGSPVEELCESVAAVIADTDIRIKRIIERDGITYEEAKSRIGAQPSNDFYRKKADYIIENNGRYDDLRAQTEAVIAQIKEKTR